MSGVVERKCPRPDFCLPKPPIECRPVRGHGMSSMLSCVQPRQYAPSDQKIDTNSPKNRLVPSMKTEIHSPCPLTSILVSASAIFAVAFACHSASAAAGTTRAETDNKTVHLASAAIVTGERATDLERLAAKEVQRYLHRISGTVLPPAGESAWNQDPKRPMILIGTPQSSAVLAAVTAEAKIDVGKAALGDEGFVGQSLEVQGRPVVAIVAAEPVAVLYGAYTLLEWMGVGFYLGGDTFPGHDLPLELPAVR